MSLYAAGVFADGVYAGEGDEEGGYATPANSNAGATVSSTSATQIEPQLAQPASSSAGATVTSTRAFRLSRDPSIYVSYVEAGNYTSIVEVGNHVSAVN
jgi:hypothetical protein